MPYKTPKTRVTEFFTPVAKVAKAVVKLPGKVLDKVEGKLKAVDKFREDRNAKMIKENFGSEKNYAETIVKKKKVIK